MQTTIKSVIQSQTFKMYKNLVNLGYKSNLRSMFSYGYDREKKYIAIFIDNVNDLTLTKLYNDAQGFEIVLVKMAATGLVQFELRKNHNYAEFVEDEVWEDYYASTGEFGLNIK